SNVEKYAASGRLVRILVEARGDRTAVQVRDAGPGIPRRERERIFLPFHRLDDRTAEGASGTGLGLSIARDLAEGMGGSLRLLPAGPEPGCAFELLLPASADAKVIAFPESRAS
ncbi:MAG TPA: ATP-binding protein, partial [Bacteroidia bacterium]|nr:ATP-binding protein [Bacteroidia bacterium]